MEQRTLEVIVISAKDLHKVNLISKMDVYAVVSISGDVSKQQFKTPIDKDCGSNPSWNFSMKFMINEAAAQQNRLFLVLKLKSERVLGDRDIGEVRVPIKELLDSPGSSGKQLVSYQVRKPDGKPKGFVSFSYQFGEKEVRAVEPVTAYPPPKMVGSGATSSYPQAAHGAPVYPPQHAYPAPQGYPAQYAGQAYPAQQGYPPQHAGYAYPAQQGYGGYPPQQAGYGYPPQQQGYGYAPQVVKPPKKNSKLGMGLGAGLLGGALGGMLLGDMISDAGSYDAGYDAGYDDGGYGGGFDDGGFDF